MISCGSVLRIGEKRNEQNIREKASSFCKINAFQRQTVNPNDDDNAICKRIQSSYKQFVLYCYVFTLTLLKKEVESVLPSYNNNY